MLPCVVRCARCSGWVLRAGKRPQSAQSGLPRLRSPPTVTIDRRRTLDTTPADSWRLRPGSPPAAAAALWLGDHPQQVAQPGPCLPASFPAALQLVHVHVNYVPSMKAHLNPSSEAGRPAASGASADLLRVTGTHLDCSPRLPQLPAHQEGYAIAACAPSLRGPAPNPVQMHTSAAALPDHGCMRTAAPAL